jgi:hypothetical protein
MEEASKTQSQARALAKSKREIRRLRSSTSFRIGVHITSAIKRPWRLIALPISLPFFAFRLGLERLGKKPVLFLEENTDKGIQQNLIIDKIKRKHAIVLFPTNGVGFGHFTRMYSVAKRLREMDPDLEIIFFTPMPTLHIPYLDNFPTYHLAGRYKHKNMKASTWNMLVEEMLTLVLETHKPKWFMFDGAFPYRGMLNAIRNDSELKKMWMRRGMFKKGSKVPIDSIGYFDLIIHPEDAIPKTEEEVEHDVKIMHIPPISLIEDDEMWSRERVLRRLGIPKNSKVAYVQLGAGKINDIESEIRMVIDALLEIDDLRIVLGESMLGNRLEIDIDRVHIIRDYPNAIYFNGFDISVQAGGYNSFHEMSKLQIPTLFLPNLETGMDDQLARCKVAETEGWGIVLEKRNTNEINNAISKLINLKPGSIKIVNGANIIADFLLKNHSI